MLMINGRIKFTKWTAWEDRATIKKADCPGVYLLARFERLPAGKVNLSSPKVIYIGETCNRPLIKRWGQFNRSAVSGVRAHSGGRTYYKKYKGSIKNLYVSAFAIDGLNEAQAPYYIRFIERKLLWDYVVKNGRPPACNRK